MGRPLGSDDRDYEFLDAGISLTDDIMNVVEDIKSISDEPEVLYQALKIESAALIIQKRIRDYRSRLIELKKAERRPRQNGKKNEEPLSHSAGSSRKG